MRKREQNLAYTFHKPDSTRVNLEISKVERVMGVKVDSDLALNEYIRAAIPKANSFICLLKNHFVCRDVNI